MRCLFQRRYHIPFSTRSKSTWAKFADRYREYWQPKKAPLPPYSHICQLGDPVLRNRAALVPLEHIKTPEFKKFLDQMRSVMIAYRCVGIAAPQVGISLRVIMVEFPEELRKKFPEEVYVSREMQTIPFKVLINPELRVVDATKVLHPESCESIKGMSALVARHRAVTVKALDAECGRVEWTARGWPARILQHEVDHLDGRVFTDLMERRSLQVDAWHLVNVHAGRISLPYYKHN